MLRAEVATRAPPRAPTGQGGGRRASADSRWGSRRPVAGEGLPRPVEVFFVVRHRRRDVLRGRDLHRPGVDWLPGPDLGIAWRTSGRSAAATGTGVTLERWTAPTGTTGTMTVQTTPVAAALPAGNFLGAQALDLPFFGWTAISWTIRPRLHRSIRDDRQRRHRHDLHRERTVQRGRRSRRIVAGTTLVRRPFTPGHARRQHERPVCGGCLLVAGAGSRHRDRLLGVGPGRRLGRQQRTRGDRFEW